MIKEKLSPRPKESTLSPRVIARAQARGNLNPQGKYKRLLHFSAFIWVVIVTLGLSNLYRLTTRNLVLENWLLEQEINDYVTAKLEQTND